MIIDEPELNDGKGKGKRRRAFRPGGGEYAAHIGPFSALSDLRERFMSAAFAMADLGASLNTLYSTHLRGNPEWLEVLCTGNIAPPSDKAVDLARTLLKPWGERWALTDDWCLYWILSQRLFDWWAQERSQFGVVVGFGQGPRLLNSTPFEVAFKGWNASEKIRTNFETEVRQRFQTELTEYCDRIERETKALGYVQTKELRNPEHFYWLAGYQVRGWSAGRIADALDEPGSRPTDSDSSPPTNEERPKRRGVERRIRGLAATIGLTLRNSRDYHRTQTGENIRITLKALSRRV